MGANDVKQYFPFIIRYVKELCLVIYNKVKCYDYVFAFIDR